MPDPGAPQPPRVNARPSPAPECPRGGKPQKVEINGYPLAFGQAQVTGRRPVGQVSGIFRPAQ
ncbi:MAG: hypothetical protein MUC97_01900 [Bernardetiaceae bacterium]|nr:hypothetical protein [Bernardetiaceae bacterium]